MMEPDFTPSGWLGILTAGLLWTPLWNPSSFEADLDSIVKQILLAVDSTDHVELLHEVLMIEEAKSEHCLLNYGEEEAFTHHAHGAAHLPPQRR